jgi:anti-sigma factor RsiW
MNCGEAEHLIDAYVDDELGAPHAQEVQAHLEGCAACRRLLAARTELRATLRAHLARHAAPAALRERILAAIPTTAATPAVERGAERAPPPYSPRPEVQAAPFWRRPPFAALLSGLAGAVAACLLTVAVILHWHALDDGNDRLLAELVDNHTRALFTNHAMDVASTDQHTVKPWFAGKLNFSPSVEDLGQAGYPLLGGRLDYVQGRPAAALVYGRRKHMIDVFVLPEAGAAGLPAAAAARQGINLVHWQRAGLGYWAVSDLNARELAAFRDLFLAAD